MDKEIARIRQLAGLNEETYSMAAYEDTLKLIDDEHEFLGKLNLVLTRALSRNNRQILAVIGQRRNQLETMATQVKGEIQRQRAQGGPQAQRKGSGSQWQTDQTTGTRFRTEA